MGEYEAIFKRKSVRKYQEEPITVAELEEVYELISRHPKLYNIDMELHLVENGSQFLDLLKGVIGSYGKIIAPHYLIATSEIKEGYLENVGYALEYIVLKMTEMGLGTCYIGGLYDKKNVKR
ncbi:nitroreductase family protein [Caloramator sp. Dgby_cultured_2]|uniref:nitroreductase family protein n=1 Tax=Caloramator sp. Dgby_cultured_2 TaxID=3029174 RepID=UPI00237E93C9|nr:nitroreductase family protein [Caloramator sp. Dgby_cultured_2]WDU82496.1 nitroreductase family protein [Caloramator sp. Dgby_cultured_2]